VSATEAPPLPSPAPGDESVMTHREVLEALSGLLLAMFVAILSSTVVTTALPRIIGDLGGIQSAYTWVVTSTLLALTVTTPIWGKLSDLFDRKLLVQTGLVLYVGGSILAGTSQSTAWLIACRVRAPSWSRSASCSAAPRSRSSAACPSRSSRRGCSATARSCSR
jgi:MFS family permease